MLPVEYSRMNIGRSKGNASMMGVADPNIDDMEKKVIAPKCVLKFTGSASFLPPEPKKINPNNKFRNIVIPNRPISAPMFLDTSVNSRCIR